MTTNHSPSRGAVRVHCTRTTPGGSAGTMYPHHPLDLGEVRVQCGGGAGTMWGWYGYKVGVLRFVCPDCILLDPDLLTKG